MEAAGCRRAGNLEGRLAAGGRARSQSRAPHVARGKSAADAQHRPGHSAPGNSGLQLLERMSPRRRARRHRHRFSPGHRHGRHVGRAADPRRRRTSSPPRRAPSTTITSANTTATARNITASLFGRRTSTSSATRAGAAARKPTAKTRSSPRNSAWRSSAACKATIRNTSRRWPARNISPSTAGRNRRGTCFNAHRPSAICTKRICRNLRPPSAKAMSAR